MTNTRLDPLDKMAAVPGVTGLPWQAGNLPLEKQVALNEALLGIQSLTLELQQRVKDLLESDLIQNKQ